MKIVDDDGECGDEDEDDVEAEVLGGRAGALVWCILS